MKLDLSKPYRTRDGRKAQAVIGPDGKLYGWYEGINGLTYSGYWGSDGTYRSSAVLNPNSSISLVNTPETRTVKIFLNIYGGGDGFSAGYNNRVDADRSQGPNRIACIEREITYTVGEGLE